MRVSSDLAYLEPTLRIHRYLSPDGNPFFEAQPDRQTTMQRLCTLAALAAGDPNDVVVTNASGLVRKVLPAQVLRDATIDIDLDSEVEPAQLAGRLAAMGYLRVPVVEDPGTFTIRGGLIDVWGAGASEPVRIDLFGDMVAAIKAIDPDSQRTTEELAAVRLVPARETILDDAVCGLAEERLRTLCDEHNYPSTKTRRLIEDLVTGRHAFGVSGYLPAFYELQTLWDYLPARPTLLVDDAAAVNRALSRELEAVREASLEPPQTPRFGVEDLYEDEEALQNRLANCRIVSCARTFTAGAASSALEALELASVPTGDLGMDDHSELRREVGNARATRGKTAVLDPLLDRIATWHEQRLGIVAVARTASQARRLASLLDHRGVQVHSRDWDGVATEPSDSDNPREELGAVVIDVGDLSHGVVAPFERRVLITEEEIFGQRAHAARAPKKRTVRAVLEDLRALSPGDYVVHSEHGVGRYLGLENRVLPGSGHLELLVVEYIGGKLFLPVYRLNQIQKYSGGDSPKLDRLGGQTFSKTKAKAKRKAREMADELLRLYAERNNVVREPLPPPDDDYAAFEAAFPYEETADQAAAIADVLSDLQGPTVADRLVCGDVGFGKTEVALRAAFRCASAGRQVAVLCPTTVLAQQHYVTFAKRLADTPFEVRQLSRFVAKKAVTDTLDRLRNGSVDIVIGTHRMLSKDVQFKNLGLLVVDEEQRFGVTHKERLKQLRTSVDVLTLTATPIPRTMQLAIGGLREMSIIATPPINRRAIRTVIARNDDGVLREALERELSRGGQVFYVYNRIEGLHERAQRLQALMPSARVAVAHGQMREATLERTMLDFVDGNYDVLVTTAIIESGLDIPRANTMLVDRADLFGLAQLYQLRGRVGRSQERAYCYLLVPPSADMSDDARSRIEALERYADLGAGFQVATLDMELRGSGDLLGAEQSGTIASVGIELFCQMLEEATRELRGEEVVHEVDPDLHFDIDALIPDDYVDEVGVRLSLYKRLASAVDENDVMHVAAEMEDRFGPAPESAVRLVEMMRLKVELRRLKVLVCEATKASVSLRFAPETPLDVQRLAGLVARQSAKYRLHPDGRLTRRLKDGEAVSDCLQLTDKMLEELRSEVYS